MNLQTVIFMGRSGCGKGTQAKFLIEEIKKRDQDSEILYLESGQKFRELLAGDTHTAQLAREIMERGALQPAFLAIHVWSHLFIEGIGGSEHLIIDGTPRKLNEARILSGALRFYKREQPIVLHINVSREWSHARLAGRKRADDGVANVEERLNWFETDVLPALEFFRDEGDMKVIDLNGEQPIEQVKDDIFAKIFS